MKKLVIVGCVLLLCCCFTSVGATGLFAYFEANGECVYKGPLSSVSSGACASNETGAVNTTPNNPSTNNNQNNTNADLEIYSGSDYSFEYPSDFIVDDSDFTRLFVYAGNESDNLNISSRILPITVNQTECQSFAFEAMDELSTYNAELLSVSVETIGGYDACRTDFTANYGTSSGRVDQTQFYISVEDQTYFLTITINSDDANYPFLEDIATSIQFN